MPASIRGPLQGLLQILRYNRSFYLLTAVLIAAALSIVSFLALPWYLGILLLGFAVLAGFWSVASLLASFYIYDRSGLTRYDWLGGWFPEAPRRVANIHAGLDESSPQLKALFPAADLRVLDIYDPTVMTEKSIERARASEIPEIPATAVDFLSLPFPENSFDAAFLIFAAHEIRDRTQRNAFFGELRRVLEPGGRILLVEHLRDAANFLAFGPGCFHFLPLSAWEEAAAKNRFAIARTSAMTPFVRVFLWEKMP